VDIRLDPNAGMYMDNESTTTILSRILSHTEDFCCNAMADYSCSHSVFQIKSLDIQLEEHQAYKPRGNKS